MESRPQRYWAADVIVVGAGASGLLAATELVAAGYSVLIVERSQVGAAQSNHSHGYMHRGHIYLKPSTKLVDDLGRGADRWRSVMEKTGVEPVTDTSLIGFVNPYEAEVATRFWREQGLEFTETEVPDSLQSSEFGSMYETREQTYDFTAWLAAAQSSVQDDGVQLLHAEVTALERSEQQVTGVVVSVDGSTIVLSSSYVVLCAGTGNLQLASSITRFRGNGFNRTSMMLVLENVDLEEISLVAHGHEARGLFIVSRPSGSGTVWLVSNYVSYASESITDAAAELWTRDIRRSLEKYTNSLGNSSSNWGYYVATKGEMRDLRNSIDSHAVQRYGLDNLCVASPTKLTLAPLLADLVVDTVAHHLHGPPRPAGLQTFQAPATNMSTAKETWRSTELSPIRSLMAL